MIIDEILRKKDADIEHLTFKLRHAQNEIERLNAAYVQRVEELREARAEVDALRALQRPRALT